MKKSIVLLLILLATIAYGAELPEGQGTFEEPYLINNFDNFMWITQNQDSWDKYFLQTSDINCLDENQEFIENYNTIGTEYTPFVGMYDGQNYVINNFRIERNERNTAMFGYVQSAGLKNINITNALVKGSYSVSILAARANYSTFESCKINGKATNSRDYTGALVAGANSCTILNCEVKADLEGENGNGTGGIVGDLSYSQLKNSSFEGYIVGYNYTGGLVGCSYNSNITKSHAFVNILASGYSSGGILGEGNHSDVKKCFSLGVINSNGERVGGIMGSARYSSIENCYSECNINATQFAGGLLGCPINNWNIKKSYAANYVYSAFGSKALCGQYMNSDNNRYIENSFWLPDISKISSNESGQSHFDELHDINTYLVNGWDFENSTENGDEDIWKINNHGFGLPKFTFVNYDDILWANFYSTRLSREVNINDTVNFVDVSIGNITAWEWDFDGDGIIDSNEQNPSYVYNNYGFFDISLTVYEGNKSHKTTLKNYVHVNVSSILVGQGTIVNPYQVNSLEDLLYISCTPSLHNKHFIQNANIDAANSANLSGGKGFMPIGRSSNCAFTGSYNGNNKTIFNLYINRPESSYQGLFGYVKSNYNNVNLTNIKLENAGIVGYENVGAIAGFSSKLIENCQTISGTVKGKTNIGGIVGQGTLIENCENNCNIYGEENVGGIVGGSLNDYYATEMVYINSCTNNGMVDANKNVGGIIGFVAKGYVKSSVNNVSILAREANLGGIVGKAGGASSQSQNVIIEGCLNIGQVVGQANYVGGVVGYLSYSSKILKSVNKSNVFGKSNVGGCVGYNRGSVENSYSKANIYASQGNAGGFIGSNFYSVKNCYSTGQVSNIGSNNGGFIGEHTERYYGVTNCFYNNQETGCSTSAEGQAITYAEMQNIETFYRKGWDFTRSDNNEENNIWGFNLNQNDSTPFLMWEDYDNAVPIIANFEPLTNYCFVNQPISFYNTSLGNITAWEWDFNNDGDVDSNEENPEFIYTEAGLYDVKLTVFNEVDSALFIAYNSVYVDLAPVMPDGQGTFDNPYLVSSVENLKWITTTESAWDKHFLQTNNINAALTKCWNNFEGMNSIAGVYNEYFSGTYNGNGFTIDSLKVKPGHAMFGTLNSASISNLNLTNFSGGKASIALISKQNSNINNCHASGLITEEEAGGIVVENIEHSVIINCTSNISFGAQYPGGIAQTNDNATISYCRFEGSFENTNGAAGIVCSNGYNGTINGSVCTGSFLTVYNSAGLVRSNRGRIENCKVITDFENSYYSAGVCMYNLSYIGNTTFEGRAITSKNFAGFVREQDAGSIASCFVNAEIECEDIAYGFAYEVVSPATITKSGFEGSINAKNVYGFASRNKSDINNCFAKGTFIAEENAYAFVETNYEALISDSYVIANIEAGNNIYGFVSKNIEGSSVNNCYSVVNTTSNCQKSGFCFEDDLHSNVYNSFWNNETLGTNQSNGGMAKTSAEMKDLAMYLGAGWEFSGITENNLYGDWGYNQNFNNSYPFLEYENPDSIAYTLTAHFDFTANDYTVGKNVSFFNKSIGTPISVEWDFNNDGTIDSVEENPVHVFSSSGFKSVKLTVYDENQNSNTLIKKIYIEIEDEIPTGEGTEDSPFLVSSLANIKWISKNYIFYDFSPYAYFKQTANINAADTKYWNKGKGYKPRKMFTYNQLNSIKVSYDGQNYAIDSLYINDKTEPYLGLFAKINGSVVKNVKLTNIDFTGQNKVGGISGSIRGNSIIENCEVTGKIEANYYAGLIAGRSSRAEIINSKVEGAIEADSLAGGIVGSNTEFGRIKNSVAIVDVSGYENIGGAVGANYDYAKISKTYCDANINATKRAGGFAGKNDRYSVIEQCYSTGRFEQYGYYFGSQNAGFVGFNSSTSKIENSYSKTSLKLAHNSNFAGFVNIGNGEIKNCYWSGSWDTSSSSFEFSAFIATRSADEPLESCYWNIETSHCWQANYATGLTNAEMKNAINFDGWDFTHETDNGTEGIWKIDGTNNDGFPYLAWQTNIVSTEDETNNNNVPVVLNTKLANNYPNPFNPTTTIMLNIAKNETGNLKIYNIKGQLVKTFAKLKPGKHNIKWNGKNNYNNKVSSGVYFYRLKTKKASITKKMLLLK